MAAKRGFNSESEAEAEAKEFFFVEVGEAEVPATGQKVPSINIGFKSQRKSQKVYGDVAMRLMKDVWKMLGIKAPGDQTI